MAQKPERRVQLFPEEEEDPGSVGVALHATIPEGVMTMMSDTKMLRTKGAAQDDAVRWDRY